MGEFKMASSLNERKIREGLVLLKEADKCLQTSWLKWKPDYDNAADKFTKAGTSFKVGKSYDQAKDAFLKAADAHIKNKSFYHGGKALEQAGMMLKEMKKIEEAADLMERAGSLYQENGTPDTAAMVLVKAAKMCEATHLKKAVELYKKAGEMKEMDDKLREAAEPYNKATQLLIKQQKFEEVVNSMGKLLELYGRVQNAAMQYKIILGLVVVYLHDSDYVAADKCFKDGFEVPGFGTSDESEAIEDLLDAYDKSDAERIKTIVAKPLFRHLDNELSKLARDLKPSEEFSISQQPTELRLISSDIAKLQIDQTKPVDDTGHPSRVTDKLPSRTQMLDFDDEEFEENPLGSEQRGDESSGSEKPQNPEDKARVDEDKKGDSLHDEPRPNLGEVEMKTDEPNPTAAEIEDVRKLEGTVDEPKPNVDEHERTAAEPNTNDDELQNTADKLTAVAENQAEEEEDEFEGGLC